MTAFLGRTLRPALFGTADPGLVDVRLHRDAFSCCNSSRTPGAGYGTAAAHSSSNLLGKLLTIGSILNVRSFRWASEKTALDENGRYVRPSQDEVTTPAHAAVF